MRERKYDASISSTIDTDELIKKMMLKLFDGDCNVTAKLILPLILCLLHIETKRSIAAFDYVSIVCCRILQNAVCS